MNEKLKPCPFCGDKEIAIGREIDYSPYGTIFAYCTNCQASGSPKESKAEAIEAWNRRTNE